MLTAEASSLHAQEGTAPAHAHTYAHAREHDQAYPGRGENIVHVYRLRRPKNFCSIFEKSKNFCTNFQNVSYNFQNAFLKSPT